MDYFTEIIFKSLIKSHLQISSDSTTAATINEHEKNALRYGVAATSEVKLKTQARRSWEKLREMVIQKILAWLRSGDGGVVVNKRNNILLFCALEEVQVQLKLLPE